MHTSVNVIGNSLLDVVLGSLSRVCNLPPEGQHCMQWVQKECIKHMAMRDRVRCKEDTRDTKSSQPQVNQKDTRGEEEQQSFVCSCFIEADQHRAVTRR